MASSVSVQTLEAAYAVVPWLLTPMHPHFPVSPLDLYSAARLSSVVNWVAKGQATGGKKRATLLQECLGILIVVFGGETFLALCTGQPPSWLLSPNLALIFTLTHAIQTRTPLRALLPAKPILGLELALAIPDAIGRTLLLTLFSVVGVLHSTSPSALPATPASLVLVPFILAVPFAAVVFSGANFFSPSLTLSTPAELQPWGWTAVDAWIPLVIAPLFLSLIAPVQGWPWSIGTDYSEQAAIVACAAVTSACFLLRAVYNHGPSKKTVKRALGLAPAKKVKKA